MKKTKNDCSLQALALQRSESYFDSRSLKKTSTSIWVQSKNLSPVLSLLQTPFVTDLEMHRHGVRASVRNVLNSNDAKVIMTMFHIHALSKIQAMPSDLMWRHGYCRDWHRRDFPHVFTGAPDIDVTDKVLRLCIHGFFFAESTLPGRHRRDVISRAVWKVGTWVTAGG